MLDTQLTVRRNAPIGKISPRLYGHFAEHLARCCYDGLWIGNQSTDIPHIGGFRTDVVNALKAMPVPMLRWPGGCYADHYHWRDGIGEPGSRPKRLGMSCGLQVEDDNSLGTHEFMALCQLLGAEPYLAGNMGSGSVQEMCDWMEYCNTALPTSLGQERAANGAAQPFGVKLWGVGNENWGCGGNYDAESYAHEYRRYATMLRHVDPSAELVACGQLDPWNQTFLQTNQRHLELIDHLSVPEARSWGPNNDLHRKPDTYEQAGTLRDALAVGIALEGFHHQCHVLSLANLAQIVNVLHAPVMTDGAAMWLTPSYYALQLHIPHIGASALPVDVAQGTAVPVGEVSFAAVSGTASEQAGGVAVTLINRHFDQPAAITLHVPSTSQATRAQLLASDSPRAINSAQFPDQVALAPLTVGADGNGIWRLELPAHSMATIQLI